MRFLDEVEVMVVPQTHSVVDGMDIFTDGISYYLMVSLQPAPGILIERLPEGQRKNAKYVMLTDEYEEINVMDWAGSIDSDKIVYNNRVYYPVTFEDWTHSHGALAHNKYILCEEAQE